MSGFEVITDFGVEFERGVGLEVVFDIVPDALSDARLAGSVPVVVET